MVMNVSVVYSRTMSVSSQQKLQLQLQLSLLLLLPMFSKGGGSARSMQRQDKKYQGILQCSVVLRLASALSGTVVHDGLTYLRLRCS